MSTPLQDQTIEANNNSTVEQGDDADPLSYTGAIVTTVGGSKRKKCMQDPTGLAVTSNGHLIVADTLNHRLVKLDPNTTKSVTFVGMREHTGYRDSATGETALFFAPYDVCLGPDGNVYVADSGNNKIRCVTPDGRTTTFVGYRQGGYKDGHRQKAKFDGPYSIAFDMSTETFYVADCNNHAIRKITTDGTVTTLTGGGEPGLKDGKCSVAKFNCPTSLCVDKGGTIYVADWGNHVVRRINRDGVVTTITNTAFEEPSGVAVDDDGTLFVTDAGLHQLFRITNTINNNNNNNNNNTNTNNSNVGDGDGVNVVTLIAGGGGVGYVDGVVANAKFNYPTGLTIDKWGNLYVTDTQNKRVRMISGLSAKNTQYPSATASTVKAESFNDNHASSSVATSSTGKSPANTISKGSLATRQALCAKMVLSAEALFVAAEKQFAKAKADLKHADNDLSSFHAKIAAGELDKLDVAESHELLLVLGVTVSISKLQDERVTGAVFAELTDADMERVLGMTKLGDRLVMKRLIRRLIKGDGLPKETDDTQGVFGWDVARVGVWLKSQGFGKFVKSFIKHAINGIALTELHPDDLWSLGVTNLGEKTELKRAIANNLPLYHERVCDVAPTSVSEQIEAVSHANSDKNSHANSNNSSTTTTNNNNSNANSNNSNATTTSKNINNSATTSITTPNNNNNNSSSTNTNTNTTTNNHNTTNNTTSAAPLPPHLSIAKYVAPPDKITSTHTPPVTPTHTLTTTHKAIPTHYQPLPSPVIGSSTATTSDTAMMGMATVNRQTSVLASTTTTSPTPPTTSTTLPPTTTAATTTLPPPPTRTTTSTTSPSPSLSITSTPPYIPLTTTGSTMSASATTPPTPTATTKKKTLHNNATTTPHTPTPTSIATTTTATATTTATTIIAASNAVPTKRKRQPTTTTTPTKPKPEAKPRAKSKLKSTPTRNNKRKASTNYDDDDDNDSNNNADDDDDDGDDNVAEGVNGKSVKKARKTTNKAERPYKKSPTVTKRRAKKEEKVLKWGAEMQVKATKGRTKDATKQIEAPISTVVCEETNENLDTTAKTNTNTSNNNNNINATIATDINSNNKKKKTTNNADDNVSNNNNDNDKHGTDRLPVNTHVTLPHTPFDNKSPSMMEITTNTDIANDVDMDGNMDVNKDVNNVGMQM